MSWPNQPPHNVYPGYDYRTGVPGMAQPPPQQGFGGPVPPRIPLSPPPPPNFYYQQSNYGYPGPMNSVLHVPGNAGAFNYHLPPASNVPYQVQQLNWPEPVPYQPNPAPAQPAAVPDTTNKQTNSHERVSASVPEEVKPRPAQVLVAEAVKPDNALLPDGRVRISKACDACNQRRRKCSGHTPSCLRCTERGVVCVYTDTGRKRGPPPQRGLAGMRRKREEEEEYEEDEDGKEAKTRESRSTDRAKRREFKFPDRPTFTPNLASEEIPDASNTGTFNVANGSDPQSHSNESASSSPVPRSPSMSISSLLGDFDDEERERQTERARERTSSPKDTAQREVAVVKIKSPPTPSTSTPSTIHLSFSPPVSAFPDLPTLPLTPTPLSILSFFLTEINPVLGYLFHPPTLTTPPPLLLAAIFGYTVPHMPFATTKERHTLSLGYFHRAQQLLQPLVPQLGSRKASLDEIVAVLLMGLLAGTSGESAGLGYRLGFFAATLARRGFGNVVEDRKEEMELARVAPEVALESERRRRIFWLLVRSDRFSAAAVADSSYELPVLPDDKVRGFLLPSEDEDYAVSVDPMVFLERGWKGEDVINGEAMGAGEVYWTARLFILLGWCVDFHKFCAAKQTDPFTLLPATHPVLPEIRHRVSTLHTALSQFPIFPSTAQTIWMRITYHIALLVLHSPRPGATMDPSLLLSKTNWLGSPSFAIATGNAGAAAALLLELPEEWVPSASHMAFTQMCAVVCYVAAVVKGRSGDLVGMEKARMGLESATKRQEWLGGRWRMAAQMSVFLGKLGEGLEGAIKGGEGPVVWTKSGLLLTRGEEHVMLAWEEAVGYGGAPGDDGGLEGVGVVGGRLLLEGAAE